MARTPARALPPEDLAGFQARLREIVGKSERAFAAKAGISASGLNQMLNGSMPSLSALIAIADTAGVPIGWLARGEGATASPQSDLVLLPHFPTQPSAGGGAVAASETEADGTVAFSAGWLRLIGVNPRRAHVLTAKGDSMEPTIRDGDLLIVDRSIDRVVDAGIYVVTVGGMVVVKRVQVNRDGTLILRSDNGRYHDEVIPADELYTITIEGRVCWSGRPM